MTKDNLQAVCFANRIYWTLPGPSITIWTKSKLQYQFNEHILLVEMCKYKNTQISFRLYSDERIKYCFVNDFMCGFWLKAETGQFLWHNERNMVTRETQLLLESNFHSAFNGYFIFLFKGSNVTNIWLN